MRPATLLLRAVPALSLSTVLAATPGGALAQTLATDDPVLRAIWEEATERSQLEPLAQALLDSLGPRLTGSPGMERAQDWAVRMLESWGVDARIEPYGTWEGWERGISHIDLLAPRVRSLEGRILAWSPGTGGRPVEGGVTFLPEIESAADWQAFLETVAGTWVMLDFPQPTCRSDEQWIRYGTEASVRRMAEERQAAQRRWARSLEIAAAERGIAAVHADVEAAGALGIVTLEWPGTPGVTRVFDAENRNTPTFELSCEDYGLLYRLALNGQSPRVRLTAEARNLGEVPVANVIGEIRGTELPDEYVMLSAHFDSWDGSSGATDNGSGSVLMLEVMRVLSIAYPEPKRTILIGLWNGEEQGLNGSRAFTEDHPEVIEGLQVLWNQDNGTGRIVNVSSQGFVDLAGSLARWLALVPDEVTGDLELDVPGNPGGSGSDYASFMCWGAPGINLSALSWDYGPLTWHSNRDTYDKLVFDDLRNNVVLTASLAYLAANDDERVSREQRTIITGRGGRPGSWPTCRPAQRSSPDAPENGR
ncbi:MAG TPA: M28 family peptidase [Longimicrobiales bacterium]|nr:M28 family peptidase [Longimicrobiales bacterium]